MPIKNVTEVYRPVRQGKIHLGIKKTKPGGVEYPKEVDYFVMKYCPELFDHYGEDPAEDNPKGIHRELNISLPSAKFIKNFDEYLERVFPQYLKRYKGKGGEGILVCKGDGEKATALDEEEGGMTSISCPCAHFESGACKKIGIFRFRVREIPSLNIYQITTSSFNSLVNLNSFIRDLLEHCVVFNIDPSAAKLILRRNKQVVQRLDKGKAKTSTHFILEIDLDPKYYKRLEDLRGIKALPPGEEISALPPPDEGKDELFFPDNGFENEEEEEVEVVGGSEVVEDGELTELQGAKIMMNGYVKEFQKKGGIISRKEFDAWKAISDVGDLQDEITSLKKRIADLDVKNRD